MPKNNSTPRGKHKKGDAQALMLPLLSHSVPVSMKSCTGNIFEKILLAKDDTLK